MKKNNLTLTQVESNAIRVIIDNLGPDPSDEEIRQKIIDLNEFYRNHAQIDVEKIQTFVRRQIKTKVSESLSLIKKNVNT